MNDKVARNFAVLPVVTPEIPNNGWYLDTFKYCYLIYSKLMEWNIFSTRRGLIFQTSVQQILWHYRHSDAMFSDYWKSVLPKRSFTLPRLNSTTQYRYKRLYDFSKINISIHWYEPWIAPCRELNVMIQYSIEHYVCTRFYNASFLLWFYHPQSHDDVIKWSNCPCYWPFVQRIHRSPVNGAELWCFFYLRLNKRLSKHSRHQRFETPSRLLWRHRFSMVL